MRIRHGTVLPLEDIEAANAGLIGLGNNSILPNGRPPITLKEFGYMFPDLQRNPISLLPDEERTRIDLIALGRSMKQPIDSINRDSKVPAGYTYLGQFISHDISREAVSAHHTELVRSKMSPMPLKTIRTSIKNTRTGALDLDSLYESLAKKDVDSRKMMLGKVAKVSGSAPSRRRPPGKDDENDLPRRGPSTQPEFDREALIGDPRNDENLVISQLHVAFLRAHNRLMDNKHTFDEARTLLRQHYQYLVIHDFLKKIAQPEIVDQILVRGNRFYNPGPDEFYLPLEFTVAAYRFGHSMVRRSYNYNQNFNNKPGFRPAMLGDLFTFTAFSGSLGPILDKGESNILENWIIEWENFVDAGSEFNFANRIGTTIVEPLYLLHDFRGVPEAGDGARLAVRNLLRGYLLRMPTGQAVANAMGLSPMTPNEILDQAQSEDQKVALRNSTFLERTPLWYYILAEAAGHCNGHCLGPVGSTIVAEVLVELVRRSSDSILRIPDWQPTLGVAEGTFTLADLLWLSGNLPGWDGGPRDTVADAESIMQ